MPTVGPHPAGRVRPWTCSAAYTSPRRAPAPIVAIPSSAHRDVVKAGQVEHDPVRRRPAGEAMPAAARGDALTGRRRVRQNADDVRHRAAADHEPGTDVPVGERRPGGGSRRSRASRG